MFISFFITLLFQSVNEFICLLLNGLCYFSLLSKLLFFNVFRNLQEVAKFAKFEEMGKCKTKAIQAYLGIFTHVLAYSGIFRHNRAYLGTLKAYSEPCVTLACSEPSYIQNPGIFRIRGIFKTLVYSEPCQTFTMERFAEIVNEYNYFRNISFSRSLLYEMNIMNYFRTYIIFTPKGYEM